MVYLIRFILCEIIFFECVFYYDLVENVVIGISKNGLECEFKNGNDCEFAELLCALYRQIPEPTDTPPPITINLIDSGTRLPANHDLEYIFGDICNGNNIISGNVHTINVKIFITIDIIILYEIQRQHLLPHFNQ